MFVFMSTGKINKQRHLQNFKTRFDPRSIVFTSIIYLKGIFSDNLLQDYSLYSNPSLSVVRNTEFSTNHTVITLLFKFFRSSHYKYRGCVRRGSQSYPKFLHNESSISRLLVTKQSTWA